MTSSKDEIIQTNIINIPPKVFFPLNPRSEQNELGMCEGIIDPGKERK